VICRAAWQRMEKSHSCRNEVKSGGLVTSEGASRQEAEHVTEMGALVLG
jgi:hypothetical protein